MNLTQACSARPPPPAARSLLFGHCSPCGRPPEPGVLLLELLSSYFDLLCILAFRTSSSKRCSASLFQP